MVVTTIKGTRGQHRRRTYVGYTTCLLLLFFGCYLFGLPYAGYGRGIYGGDDDQRDERTTSPKNVRWLYYLSVVFCCCCYLFGVSHMLHGYGGGTTTRRMVATTMGREDNITEESMLAMLPVCCLLLFFCLFVVSRMPANGGRTATRRMFYVDKRPDGSTFNHLVLRGRDKVERVFMECHLTAGGHKGRDATLGKIKERYYWPNCYKEVESKVREMNSNSEFVHEIHASCMRR